MNDIDNALKILPHLEALALVWTTKVGVMVALILLGWFGAAWIEKAIKGGLSHLKRSDPMVTGFFANLTRWLILGLTGLAILDEFGVQTTSIVTILGAAGLAVGLAMQSTLTNLAAGIMLLLFRPFGVGDVVETASVTGTVQSMSLFHTELVTPDNVLVIAPNSVLWGVTLKNTTHYPMRRLTLTVPIPFGQDVDQALASIKVLIDSEPRIALDPPAELMISQFRAVERVTEVEIYAWVNRDVLAALKVDLYHQIWRAVVSQFPASP